MTVKDFMDVFEGLTTTIEVKSGEKLLAKLYGCGDILDDTLDAKVITKITMPKPNYVLIEVEGD